VGSGGLNAVQSHTPEGDTAKGTQMPTAADYFKSESKYFRSSDFTKEIIGTIGSVESAEFKNDDGSAAVKPVLHFQDMPRALVLNKTNFTALSLMFGEDTDGWVGENVALCPSRVDFKGKTMPTIKVRRPQKASAATASGGHPFDDVVAF
jgi:hypothetical protein